MIRKILILIFFSVYCNLSYGIPVTHKGLYINADLVGLGDIKKIVGKNPKIFVPHTLIPSFLSAVMTADKTNGSFGLGVQGSHYHIYWTIRYSVTNDELTFIKSELDPTKTSDDCTPGKRAAMSSARAANYLLISPGLNIEREFVNQLRIGARRLIKTTALVGATCLSAYYYHWYLTETDDV